MEHDRKLERERLFLMYTKQWWKEYLALRPAHSDRLVKIFTEVITLDLNNPCSDSSAFGKEVLYDIIGINQSQNASVPPARKDTELSEFFCCGNFFPFKKTFLTIFEIFSL